MSIKFKGIFKSENQLKKTSLSENLNLFFDTNDILDKNKTIFVLYLTTIFLLSMFIINIILLIKNISNYNIINNVGFIIFIFSLLIHEYIHAIFFPKNADVEIWLYFEKAILFVYSNSSMSKIRYIIMVLSPMFLLGFIPLILWLFVDLKDVFINTLVASYLILTFSSCGGDYIYFFNIINKVPKGAYILDNGFQSYWYFPEGYENK